MSLANFAEEIRNRGVAKSSRFEVDIPPPPFMANDSGTYPTLIDDNNLIQLMAESVHFPEYIVETMQIRDDGIGREIPYNKIYPPVVCTFICDADMNVKKFFDDWVQGIMKTPTGTIRYSDQYMVDKIRIGQTNTAGEITYTVNLYDAYPKLVNDIAMSSSSREFNRCVVQFVYRNWDSEKA